MSPTCMDQEKLDEAKEKVQDWLADKNHRKCCKVALCAANAVILMGLTAGLTLLWMNELYKKHHHCCRGEGKM